jgi:hypothetical protein
VRANADDVAEGIRVNRGVSVLLLLAAGGLGVAVGVALGRSHSEGRTEDVVATEIALLNRYKDVPSCGQIAAAGKPTGESTVGDVVVHWRYKAAERKLERVVVAADLTTAYEEVERACGAPADR